MTRISLRWPALGALALGLAACAVPLPSGPTVAIMPGNNKSFEAFSADDLACRQYADSRINPGAAGAASHSANAYAIGSTVFGAALGALFGVAGGNPGAGAAIGAGSGALFGTAGGAGSAGYSAYGLQQQYDLGYTQCMVAKGNTLPPTTAYAPPYGRYYYGYPRYYYSYPMY